MTVSTADLREEYVATAGQTVFTFNFRVFGNTDVKVYQTPAGVDFDDATYLITAYTMTPNADQDASQGGVVTLDSGATLGDRITIISNVSETRSTDYKDGGVFDPDLVDNDMDRSLSIAKQAKEAIRLAPSFNESAHGASGIQLPELTPNTIWRVNAAGTALEAITLGDGIVENGIPLANYAALRAYDSSSLADGQIIVLSDNGGYFAVKSGAVSDDGFSTIVFTDNASRYAERVEPAYSNTKTLKEKVDEVAQSANVTYDNASSGLTATDVQAAIDEVAQDVSSIDSANVTYDNTTSGLTATDVQAAIDEVASSKTLVHSVDVTTTSSQSLTANTPAEITGLSVTLTPQSTNSKFLLMANWNGEGSNTNNQNTVFGFKRDSSYIGNPAAAGNRSVGRGVLSQGYYSSDADSTMDSWDGQYLDEPNTTNSITYKVFIHTRDAQTLYNNRTVSDTDTFGQERATSSLIILEIT
jgi:hypothetical protein